MYNYIKKILMVSFACCSMAAASAPVIRLDCQRLDNGKLLVRNYGYDSTNILLSWGCAAEVINIVTEQDCASKMDERAARFLESRRPGNRLTRAIETRDSSLTTGPYILGASASASVAFRQLDSEVVAVVGGGISGMMVAHLLRKFGYQVNMYAKKMFRPNSTAHCMKQILLPEDLELLLPEAEMLMRINNFAKKCMSEMLAKESEFAGVFEAENVYFRAVSDDGLPMGAVSSVPFADKPVVVDLPIYMEDLYRKMLGLGVMPLVEDRFGRREAIFELSEDIIIDCTGMSA